MQQLFIFTILVNISLFLNSFPNIQFASQILDSLNSKESELPSSETFLTDHLGTDTTNLSNII